MVGVHAQPDSLRFEVVCQRPHAMRELRGIDLQALGLGMTLVDKVAGVDIQRSVASRGQPCRYECIAKLADQRVVDSVVKIVPRAER